MNIDFNAELKTIYGTPLLERAPDPDDPTKTTEQVVTLRAMAVGALLRDEQGADGKAKLTRYLLAKRIHESNGAADLAVKEAALLQRLIGNTYPPLMVGQALPLLEG